MSDTRELQYRDDALTRTRREKAWPALAALFAPEPDYPVIARALRGYSLDEVRDILFSDIAPVCGAAAMGEDAPEHPCREGAALHDAIRAQAEKSRTTPGAVKAKLHTTYLRLYFRDLWSAVEEKLPALWAQTRLTPTKIASLAHRAMLLEVEASPKPGLVSPDHNGAHKDMDYPLFVVSANSLVPYLEMCAAMGMQFAQDAPEDLFPKLRKAGISAERTMFAATNGVNTHKGLLFSMGLVCAAGGRRLAQHKPLWPVGLARDAAAIVTGIVERDLGPLLHSPPERSLTAGERLFVEHGIGGIREEAESAFPSAIGAFERLYYMYGDLPFDKAFPQTLLWLMSATVDTNILSRGGMDALAFIREAATACLEAGGMYTAEGKESVLALREECVRRNISPGGSADLLALAIFFRLLQDAE